MKIIPIRALQDNYMYLLVNVATRHAAAVDPVNASAMATAVHDHKVDLKAVLTTHHHHDHAHGNADLLSMFPDLTIYGGDSRIQALNKSVSHGDKIKLGTLSVECLSTPCHTRGHICYYVAPSQDQTSSLSSLESEGRDQSATIKSDQQSQASAGAAPSGPAGAVFTGDTLFLAGCGRFFEGTAEQMNRNLNSILGGLPDNTRVYCGHEYSVANLKFALTVEPSNAEIKNKLSWAQQRAARREPSVPSTIGEERKINPFMRLRRPAVQKFAGETDELEVMTVLRQRKNEFRASQ